MSQFINALAIAFCILGTAMIASMTLLSGIHCARWGRLLNRHSVDIYRSQNPILFWFGAILSISFGSCGIFGTLVFAYVVFFAQV